MSAEMPASACGRLFPVYVSELCLGSGTKYAAYVATLPYVSAVSETEEAAVQRATGLLAWTMYNYDVYDEELPFQPAEMPPEGAVLRWVQVPPTAQRH